MQKQKSVAFHTLGCKLNFSEAATLSRQMEGAGFEKKLFDDVADVYEPVGTGVDHIYIGMVVERFFFEASNFQLPGKGSRFRKVQLAPQGVKRNRSLFLHTAAKIVLTSGEWRAVN